MRVASGRDFQARVMGNNLAANAGTALMAPAGFMGVSTTPAATAPIIADGNTSLTGELTANGFQRAQATFGTSAGANSYTLTKTFTSSDGTARTIERMAIFNAVSAGTMVFETAVPSPPTLVSGDQVTITETVSLI